MKKLFSLSLFFFLGVASVHASQTLSSHTTLEVRSENPAYSIAAVQHHAAPLPTGAKDTGSTNCLKAVAAGDLQKLHHLLWYRSKSKSKTVVSGYCAEVQSQVQIRPEIKRLISNFVCLFEDDANEIKYENGVTLLHTACMFPSRQSIAIVAFILSLNIDVNAKSEYGYTALHYLCDHRCPLAWEEHVIEMFDLIMKKGGSCEIKNKWQDTPLHTLFKYRLSATPLPLDVLKRFKGKVMNEVNESGMTPLHIACDYNRLSQYSNPKSTCMRRLWIDVKRVAYYRKWKRTGYVEGIKYLLPKGGHPSLRIQDDKGRTPYDLAHRAGFRKPCVCCGIVCCNEELPLPCFPIPHADHTEKELLLAVDPLADSVCPKLSYCCWATRTNTKLSMIMVASGVILLAKILFFAYRYIL